MNDLATAAKEAGLVKSKDGKILGVEGLGGRHLLVANIVLVQGTSAHFIEKGLLPGKIVNSLTNQAIEDTTFVTAYMTEKLFVYKYLDEPKCSKKEFDFVADDEFDKRLDGRRMNWEDKMKPEVIPTIIVAAIMGGKPVKMSFRGASGYPAGQKLWSLVYESANEQNTPLWGIKYKLKSYGKKNKAGDNYYAFDIEKSGTPTDSEVASATALFQSFKEKTVLVEDVD